MGVTQVKCSEVILSTWLVSWKMSVLEDEYGPILGHVAWAQVVYWLSDLVKVGQQYVTMIK